MTSQTMRIQHIPNRDETDVPPPTQDNRKMDRLGPPPAAPIIHRPVINQQSEPRPLAPAHAAAGIDIFQPPPEAVYPWRQFLHPLQNPQRRRLATRTYSNQITSPDSQCFMIYELVERSRGGRSERGIFQSSNVVPFTKICSILSALN